MIKLSESTKKCLLHQVRGNENKVTEAIHGAEVVLVKCKNSTAKAMNFISAKKNHLSTNGEWSKYDDLCLQE